MKQTAITVIMICSAALGAGQTTDKKTLTEDGARRAIDGALSQARKLNTTGVIAVVDDGGNLMALQRIDGTFGAGANISIGKARTAALFKKPTKAFEEIIGKGRTAMVALNDFTPLQGGVPITVENQIVGAVGVSGAASAAQDEELAMAGVAAVQNGLSPVTYLDSMQVENGFAKGAVLFDASDKYMVHASRREKPGQVEVHSHDADIVHVLDGTATLVTGGKGIGMKPIASDEFRGSDIVGGDTRQLKKGDVIIIPAGVPHWFKEVSNPFLYYVVKSR